MPKMWSQCEKAFIVNKFFDTNLDLRSDFYEPWKYHNDATMYITRHSNYLRVIIKQLSNSINKMISALLSNKYIFAISGFYAIVHLEMPTTLNI